ncbi:hypothetical protein M8494_28175 [Serratia ureilytica]|jgi:hypothetical protein
MTGVAPLKTLKQRRFIVISIQDRRALSAHARSAAEIKINNDVLGTPDGHH